MVVMGIQSVYEWWFQAGAGAASGIVVVVIPSLLIYRFFTRKRNTGVID